MTDLKDLTLQDVVDQVEEFFSPSPTTTTLDIKLALRKKGFYATQDMVAQAMYAVWGIFGWHWTFNGTYRTYYPDLSSAQAAYDADSTDIKETSWLGWISSDSDLDDITAAPNADDNDPIDKDSLVNGEPKETTTPNAGDWVAFSYSRHAPISYVTGVVILGNGPVRETARMTARNKVRQFYSQKTGTQYADTGANIIK